MLSRQFKFPKVVDSRTLPNRTSITSNLLGEIPSINTCCQHARHKSISQSLVNMSVGDNRNKQTCNQLANKEKTSIIHFLYVKRTRNRRTYDKSQLNALTLTNTCIDTPLSWAEVIAAEWIHRIHSHLHDKLPLKSAILALLSLHAHYLRMFVLPLTDYLSAQVI